MLSAQRFLQGWWLCGAMVHRHPALTQIKQSTLDMDVVPPSVRLACAPRVFL